MPVWSSLLSTIFHCKYLAMSRNRAVRPSVYELLKTCQIFKYLAREWQKVVTNLVSQCYRVEKLPDLSTISSDLDGHSGERFLRILNYVYDSRESSDQNRQLISVRKLHCDSDEQRGRVIGSFVFRERKSYGYEASYKGRGDGSGIEPKRDSIDSRRFCESSRVRSQYGGNHQGQWCASARLDALKGIL